MNEEHPIHQETVVCPACGQSDRVFKVSRIYIDALAAFNKSPDDSVLPDLTGQAMEDPGINLLKIQAVRAFVNNFSPPSGGKQQMRQVHPDLVVGIFSLVAIFFLIQIYNTQRAAFPIILVVLIVFYLGYILLHQRILARFNQQSESARAEKRQLEIAIERWMKLYFCARDEVVFDPAQNRMIPLDQMDQYLLETNDTNQQPAS